MFYQLDANGLVGVYKRQYYTYTNKLTKINSTSIIAMFDMLSRVLIHVYGNYRLCDSCNKNNQTEDANCRHVYLKPFQGLGYFV